jgi:hypothetical protein
VAAALVVAAATGCGQPLRTPGELTIDFSPDVRICLPDQASSGVEGTSLALSFHSGRSGTWTLESLAADPADNLIVTDSWLVPETGQSTFGNGFPLPPTRSYPAQAAAWKNRRRLAGSTIDGDPAQYVAVLQLNRTAVGAGRMTGLVLDYSDAKGGHTQTAAGFTVTLNPPGVRC